MMCSNVLHAQRDSALHTQDSTRKHPEAVWLALSGETAHILSDGTPEGERLLDSSRYSAINLRVGWQVPSPDVYAQLYRHPMYGLGFYYSRYRNENFGHPLGLYGWFDIPFTRHTTGRWRFSYYGAFGLSFNFNPFDEKTNPNNKYIGSKRNVYVSLMANATYFITPRLAVIGGVGFRHFSNSARVLPNYGINMIPVQLALAYKINKVQIDKRLDTIPRFKPRWLTNVWIAGGHKEYEIGGDAFLKMTFAAEELYQFSYKFRAGIGFNAFYASGAQKRDSSTASGFSKAMSYGITANGEWVLRPNLYVPLAIGYYLKHHELNDETQSTYVRVGVRAKVWKNWFAGITVKAHGGTSDVFEWTAGHTFGKDRNNYKRLMIF